MLQYLLLHFMHNRQGEMGGAVPAPAWDSPSGGRVGTLSRHDTRGNAPSLAMLETSKETEKYMEWARPDLWKSGTTSKYVIAV